MQMYLCVSAAGHDRWPCSHPVGLLSLAVDLFGLPCHPRTVHGSRRPYNHSTDHLLPCREVRIIDIGLVTAQDATEVTVILPGIWENAFGHVNLYISLSVGLADFEVFCEAG